MTKPHTQAETPDHPSSAPAQGFDRLVADIRATLKDNTVEQIRQEYTQRLVEAVQDDRDRTMYVVDLLVESAVREALRQRRADRAAAHRLSQIAPSPLRPQVIDARLCSG